MTMKGFFARAEDGVFTGVGLSAINRSKDGYNSLLNLFGGRDNMPSSVMRAKRAKPTKETDAPVANRSYKKMTSCLITDAEVKSQIPLFQKAHGVRGKGCGAGALSTFPQNVGRSVVLFYSEPRQTVFDPFAGHNSRMELCVRAGRHYIGCDLSNDFMAFNYNRREQLLKELPSAKITLHHTDSRKIPVQNAVGDFTLTSPPYWDIEYYGDEPQQLGKSTTYEGFLKGLRKVMRENLRCLKPGAFSVWFVNDFRRDKKMYFYHMDVKTLMESVGFVAHDILIVDLGRGFGDCFPNRMMKRRIIPKRHEYGLVFRKPLA